MKNINNYNQYLFEQATEMEEIFNDADILESIVTDSDALLKSIEAEEIDLFTTFELSRDEIKSNVNIQELYDNTLFNRQLEKLNYKKNDIESTEESETFIKETIQVMFFSIYKNNQSELEQPKYIIYQSKIIKDKKWNNLKAYSVNADMQKFYSKLTNKSIEINSDNKTYVYNTSNSGVDWQMQKNHNNQDNKIFKDMMTNNEIKAILVDNNISITIIA